MSLRVVLTDTETGELDGKIEAWLLSLFQRQDALDVGDSFAGETLQTRGASWIQYGSYDTDPFPTLLPAALGFGSVLNKGQAGRRAQDNAQIMVSSANPLAWDTAFVGPALLHEPGNNLIEADTQANRSAALESVRAMVALMSARTRVEQTGWTFKPNSNGEDWNAESAQAYASGGSIRAGFFSGLQVDIPVPAGTSYLLCHGVARSAGRGATVKISQNGVQIASKSLDDLTVATPAPMEAKEGISPAVIRLPNLAAGVVTATVDQAGVGGSVALVDALLPQAAKPRLIILVKPVTLRTATHNKPELLAYLRTVPDLVAAEFGDHVLVVDPEPGWNPNTMLGADGLHPNALGAAHMRDAIIAAVRAKILARLGTLTNPATGALTGKTAEWVDQKIAAKTSAGLNARSVDALISALDMRDTRSLVVGQVGDSTADYSDEWFETAFKEMFASQWPDRPARLKRWNRTDNQYPAAFTTWQTAEIPAVPGSAGGTFANTVIASDGYARVGALVGSNMDAGSSAYTGTAGVLTTDGDRLVTNASASAIVAAGMKPRDNADFSAKVTQRVTSKASANRQAKWYAVRKDASNDLEIAYAGSTVITVTVVGRIAGTAKTIYTFPAGTIPSNTDPADYAFEMALAGTTLTAKVNGVSMPAYTLTADEVTAVAGMTSTGFSTPSEPTWSADALEVRGTVTVAASAGTAATPSPLGYVSVYNGAIAGSTIEAQRTRLPQILPERPDLLVITHGHNYGTATAEEFIASIDAFLDALFTLYDDKIPVAIMSENPRFTGDAVEAAHRNRQIGLRARARERGWLYLPGFEAYARLADGGKSYINAVDRVHPTPVGSNPSGARLQADAAKRVVLALSERRG